MHDVAIIGVGLHPFGRFEGKTAMEMGVDAIGAAVVLLRLSGSSSSVRVSMRSSGVPCA